MLLTVIKCAVLLSSLTRLKQIHAISANPNPISEKGLPLYYIRGDENFHWIEDENGYTIIDEPDSRLPNTTRKVYAQVDEKNGNLISSGIRFGELSSSSLGMIGLKKHATPSAKIRKAICGDYCDDLFSVSGMNKEGMTRRRRMQQQQKAERANRRQLASSEGSLKNLVVLVRFADHVNRKLPSPNEYDILLNGAGSGSTSSITPTGSVNDVFLTNSYGKLSLQSTVYPWITLSRSEAYYGDNKSGIGSKIFEAIREALDYIDLDPTFDISEFNTDYDQGDRYIDAITIIHSGYGAEFGGPDCYGTAESNRIWSHSWFMYDHRWTSKDGKVRVSDYHINPGLWGTCGSEISRVGVIAHETFHFLGLPDLYDTSGGGYGIGDYCLMSNSWGVDGTQRYPPILSAWSKIELGWIDPITISEKGDYTIRQSYEFPDVYKIDVGYAPNEYLLIENRQPGSFDRLLQLGGLAIWHIDENISQHGNEGYPGQLGWPSNNKHYVVALLQADGRYDLERGVNYGDYGDLFRSDYFFGVDHLFPSKEHPIFGPFPNTDSYSRRVARANNFISGISTSGPEMTFSLLPSSPCQPNEIHFDMTLLIDGKGNEVSWTLTETYTDELALSGDIYSSYSQYNVEECLPARCYTFTISDTGNDGLCCDHGYGGYSVRLNGLKLASGNQFSSQDKTDLECISVPPTVKPLVAPSKSPTAKPTAAPTSSPSTSPSFEPSSAPSGMCGRHDGTLEITLEGGVFVDGISWEVKDTFNQVLVYENVDNNVGLYTTELCVPLDACYTFTIHNSMTMEDEENRLLYSVKLDGKMIANGRDFGTSQSTIFGNNCLRNAEISCTDSEQNGDTTIPMSMFRLEIASADRELSWKLVDDSNHFFLSSGPLHECNINSNAVCLPREACYEFIVVDEDGCCSFGNDKFTVLFTQTDVMIQNYTGSVNGDFKRVFLGTCYEKNFQ